MNVGKVKKLLEKRLETLGARIEDIKDDLRTRPNPDSEDRATEVEGDEVLEGLENFILSEITLIRTALDRIQKGTYGECETCGESIGKKRLEAIPHAVQCINCAS